jgi:hypothetical protein
MYQEILEAVYTVSVGNIVYFKLENNDYVDYTPHTSAPKTLAHLYRPQWIKRTYYETWRDEIVTIKGEF